jgi:hypothetical protein
VAEIEKLMAGTPEEHEARRQVMEEKGGGIAGPGCPLDLSPVRRKRKPKPCPGSCPEESEQWELEIIQENIESDSNGPSSPVYWGHNYEARLRN